MGDDTSMSHGPWDEILSWLKEDRLKVAVLESQVAELRRANEESRHTQAEILSRLDALRDETRRVVKEAMQDHLQGCLALQRQMIRPDTDKGPAPATDMTAVLKHLGAAVAGAGIMIAALWDKLVR